MLCGEGGFEMTPGVMRNAAMSGNLKLVNFIK